MMDLEKLARETAELVTPNPCFGAADGTHPKCEAEHRDAVWLKVPAIASALQRVRAESLKLASSSVCYAAEEHGAEYDQRVLHTAECRAIRRAFAAAQNDPEVSR